MVRDTVEIEQRRYGSREPVTSTSGVCATKKATLEANALLLLRPSPPSPKEKEVRLEEGKATSGAKAADEPEWRVWKGKDFDRDDRLEPRTDVDLRPSSSSHQLSGATTFADPRKLAPGGRSLLPVLERSLR